MAISTKWLTKKMLLKVENVKLDAVAACVSSKVSTLEERLSGLVDGKKFDRIKGVAGFDRFSVADAGVCTSDFCTAAAEKIFDETSLERNEIRALIFVSQTPDYIMPATAQTLQARLKLPRDIAAFDINLGCSGFVNGLYVASSMLSAMPDGKILLLCGDTNTRNMFGDDVSCQSVFGDGGAAAIVSKRDGQKIFFNLQTFGELADVIIRPRGAFRNPLIVDNNALDVRENFVTMDGVAVMNFSVRYVPANISALLNFAGVEPSSVELFLMHQANRLIVETIAARMNLPRARFPFGAGSIGNTSSASIPLMLTERRRLDEPTELLTVMSGFGVGMSIASAVVDLRDTIILSTGEL